jgi:ParB family transcriptional regulator, chromosome partitioning protein
VVTLLGRGEVGLLRLVEGGRIPLSVASEISQGTSDEIQRALTDAYQTGELRGRKLRAARDLIRKRTKSGAPKQSKLKAQDLTRQYREYTREQRELVKRASVVNSRLALIGAACRKLFADENFMNLLRAEQLTLVSDRLIQLVQGV